MRCHERLKYLPCESNTPGRVFFALLAYLVLKRYPGKRKAHYPTTALHVIVKMAVERGSL